MVASRTASHRKKTKHPCWLTEVSEAEQRHRPRRIARLPRIIGHTQSSSTSHRSKGCAQMSLTAETRLPPWGLAYLNPPAPMFFIGTLSQTLTLRAAFASSTYLLSQIPGPGRSSDDDLLIPLIPFSGGTSGPSGFPSPHGFPCSPTPARHPMMPCCWVAEHDHFCQRKLSPHHRHNID